MTIIELLKKNWVPFGGWPDPECYGKELGEEMQAKAREIGTGEFNIWRVKEWGRPGAIVFDGMHAYRLRADYEDEPVLVECEIQPIAGGLSFIGEVGRKGGELLISNAINSPDHDGFKFEDGSWYDVPIKPVGPDGKLWSGNITVDDIVSGRVQVLHASHVLFRRKKQE